MPVPSSRSTSPSAKISFSSAQSAGMWTPCGSKWPWLRDTERPSAPAFMPSRTRSCICLDLVVGRGALLAVVAHHVVAHGGMADQIADIDAEIAVELGPCIAGTSPNEFERVEDLHRDRFDIGQELGQARWLALPLRTGASDSEQLPNIDRGRAVVARERAERVPGDLRVVMAVVVDKAGRDGLAAGIDGLRRRRRDSLPISTILPSLTATSPRYAGPPEPSTMRPFLISRS